MGGALDGDTKEQYGDFEREISIFKNVFVTLDHGTNQMKRTRI